MTLASGVEKFGPWCFSLGAAIAFYFRGQEFFVLAKMNQWDLSAFYAAVFDIASIVCAFLFSFLVFIKTTENKVLSAFRENRFYKTMEQHFVSALLSSFILTLSTTPLIVTSPVPVTKSPSFFVLLLWFSLCTFVMAATFRSGYQFLAVLEAAYSRRFRS